MDYIFASATSTMMNSIAHDVREQLLLQEPRITDVQVSCREMNRLTGAIVVEISYTVRSTNNRYNNVYPFYMTEGSEGVNTL